MVRALNGALLCDLSYRDCKHGLDATNNSIRVQQKFTLTANRVGATISLLKEAGLASVTSTAKPMTPDRSVERTKVVADTITTPCPVNCNNREWFEHIMTYLEMKAIGIWMEDHPTFNECDWKAAWPGLLDIMMRNAHRQTLTQLNEQKLINLN